MIASVIITAVIFAWIFTVYYRYQRSTMGEGRLRSALSGLACAATFTPLTVIGLGIGPWSH